VADRRTFEQYARLARDSLPSLLAMEPLMDGSDVRVSDDLRRFPLAYGVTHRGELRRFVRAMEVLHRAEGIARVVELVDDVNYGLPQAAWTIIALHKAATIRRPVYFNLNHLTGIPEILSDRGELANRLTGMELRYIYQQWQRFEHNVTFWKLDSQVAAPW
jgi:hypothetical protein